MFTLISTATLFWMLSLILALLLELYLSLFNYFFKLLYLKLTKCLIIW